MAAPCRIIHGHGSPRNIIAHFSHLVPQLWNVESENHRNSKGSLFSSIAKLYKFFISVVHVYNVGFKPVEHINISVSVSRLFHLNKDKFSC